MPHPVSRPRCGTCYGRRFDSYWNGQDSPPFYATLEGGRYMGSDPLPERATGAALRGSGGC